LLLVVESAMDLDDEIATTLWTMRNG